jgi:hypothetical protein
VNIRSGFLAFSEFNREEVEFELRQDASYSREIYRFLALSFLEIDEIGDCENLWEIWNFMGNLEFYHEFQRKIAIPTVPTKFHKNRIENFYEFN